VFVHGGSKVDVSVKAGVVELVVLEAGSTGSVDVRNPWPGQSATVIDGGTSAVVVAATSAASFAIPTMAGRWYALVPASAAASPPRVTVTAMAATKALALGSAHIGL
jgi:hypothetical protein